MKKVFILAAIVTTFACMSCNQAHNKTGGAARDSSASHGNSGPADTSNSARSSAPGGDASSDTSHTGKSTAEPTVDSAKH